MIGFEKKHCEFCFSIIVLIVVISTAGCETKLQTGYGRAKGVEYATSVNGTVVFQEMVKAAGHDVDRYRKISPRWENYDTVYWIPDHFNAPREEAVNEIENWLATGWDRTLVYVARDFDAAIVYWDKMQKNGTGSQSDRYPRDFAEAITDHFTSKNRSNSTDCAWYDWSEHPFEPAGEIAGPLAENVDTDQAELYLGSLPISGDVSGEGVFNDYDVEVLLTVDSIPFAFSLTRDHWSGGRIIIVGNGSFVLNLPLANPQNRELANNLIQEVDESQNMMGDVLFVESQGQIQISDHDAPDQFSKWGWITKQPLRYIVPNIVFWCLLFCFVYFPISGRPRRIKHRSTSNFRDHIDALAQLLRRTKAKKEPAEWIEDFRRHNSGNQKSM